MVRANVDFIATWSCHDHISVRVHMNLDSGILSSISATTYPVSLDCAGSGGAAVVIVGLGMPGIAAEDSTIEVNVDGYIRAVIDTHGANGRGELI